MQTGYQRAVPFGGLKGKIETVRGATSRDGALRITLENATPGDRLVMRKSVTGIAGAWSDRGHVYTLTVSDTISSEDIDTAVSEVYYRASEVAGEQVRRVLVHWVDNSGGRRHFCTRFLFTIVLLFYATGVLARCTMTSRRHPVQRRCRWSWGIILTRSTCPRFWTMKAGWYASRSYSWTRTEMCSLPTSGSFYRSSCESRHKAGGLVVRELRSSDRKARALVIEVADEKPFVSPAFMSRFLQGLDVSSWSERRHSGPGRAATDFGLRFRWAVAHTHARDGSASG